MMNKKQQIIETAFTLFYRKGINSVGVADIIAQANVAKKTLYNHFESKDDLVLATIEFHHHQFLSWITKRLDQAEVGKDALLVFFESLEDWFENKVEGFAPFRGCYFHHCCVEFPDAAAAIYIASKNHKAHVSRLIAFNIDSFERNKEKAQQLKETIFLLQEGIISTTFLEKTTQYNHSVMIAVENLLGFKR
ncbi:MAG TPA: TetR/AcrR family transcriptional regulator [Psychromonas hadalis]|nr:TetR/AcrR family transcriptional regulator [Psychromonas hadalis]